MQSQMQQLQQQYAQQANSMLLQQQQPLSASATGQPANQAASTAKPEEQIKKMEAEISVFLSKFNDPMLEDGSLDDLRRKLSHLYNEKGMLNWKRTEYLESIHDYTKALEFYKTDVTFFNRGMVFVKFELPQQALDDFCNALVCNPKNQRASMMKAALDLKFAQGVDES